METAGTPDERRNVERIARALGRMAHNWVSGANALAHPIDSVPVSHLRNALAAKDRPHFVAAVADACRRGYLVRQQGSDRLHPGDPVPQETRLALVAELDAAGAYTS